jgi:hypothetical protein
VHTLAITVSRLKEIGRILSEKKDSEIAKLKEEIATLKASTQVVQPDKSEVCAFWHCF